MWTFQRISITGAMVLALGVVGARAAELPRYEVAGFPISPLQMSVLNTGHVQEESPSPDVVLHGMLISPHQSAILNGPAIARCVCSQDAKAVQVR